MKLTRYLLAGTAIAAAATTSMVFAQSSQAAPAPVVTSVTPAADTTGSQVVVSGSNLTDPANGKLALPTAIFFGTVKAHVNSCADSPAASCNVTVPPQCLGQKRVDVRVVVGTLESAVSSGDGFTYTDAGTGPSPTSCASPTSTATARSCRPLTNGGNCYKSGEFCRKTDHGASGTEADGAAITCINRNGWRWELTSAVTPTASSTPTVTPTGTATSAAPSATPTSSASTPATVIPSGGAGTGAGGTAGSDDTALIIGATAALASAAAAGFTLRRRRR